LQATVRSQLRALARDNGTTDSLGVIAGWTVVDPVSEDRPLDGLRQAIRGAAVVARVEAQRALVLAAVTHELRTPLTAILGYAERLRDESDLDTRERMRYGGIVAQEARRLHRLVETLIDAGAWTAGRLALSARPQSLRTLARAAWSALSVDPGRRICFDVRGDATPVVDPERIQQVFINLLDNAVRHSPASGRVRMRIAASAGIATVHIEDDGSGFSKRAAAALGTPFAPDADGRVGLGLSIARLLVEAHGGSLQLASRPRRGGHLEIRLPVSAYSKGEKRVTTR
jgi:signal transduction histidine kinase